MNRYRVINLMKSGSLGWWWTDFSIPHRGRRKQDFKNRRGDVKNTLLFFLEELPLKQIKEQLPEPVDLNSAMGVGLVCVK